MGFMKIIKSSVQGDLFNIKIKTIKVLRRISKLKLIPAVRH